ncbi:sec-C motif domain protein [Shewanella sediminis HAW-EB3]|uniref:Sec-C motif domain protein n=1 Tax=Shewanella sediminis (strain HAW-EB3) TaxID=425104 RepID=A8FSQ2_SHESH|nr:sulfotransferase [Shewanella sediminis]ABV35875.1 sec-C motif domain protein [Shewanella sediminis HAW-EB3]
MNNHCFDRPIIILSAPRSGSTLLFEILSKSRSLWTIGGESHAIIEGHRELNITSRNFDSNALDESDWNNELHQSLRQGFKAQLRNADDKPYREADGPVRFLEKTPKNSLRIDFLNKVFPDAIFIYLIREPKENISSIMQAWRSGRFRTYPMLPGFGGDWSLLLPKNWRALKGLPLENVAAFQWLQANESIMNSLSKLPDEKWHMLSYRDLVGSPYETISSLTEFCQIPFDDELKKICGDALPHSRYTVSAPAVNKWLQNYDAIKSIWPGLLSCIDKMNSRLTKFGLTHLDRELQDNLAPSVSPKSTAGVSFSGISRNAPCPCGSQKRFKHCHGLAR